MEIITLDKYLEEIKKENLTVVDFFALWCSPCKILGPILEKVSKDYEDVNFYKLDIDSEEGRDLAVGLGINSIPTVIFYKDNKEIHRAIGLANENQIRSQIDDLI